MCVIHVLLKEVEGSIITISEPIVSPWDSGTLPGGDTGRTLPLAAYYVKSNLPEMQPVWIGINTMGVDTLRNLLQTE